MSYIVETRTGNGTTRKVVEGNIEDAIHKSECGITENFLRNYLPLDMLPPLTNVSSKSRRQSGPTDEELDAIEREEDQDL